MSKPICPYCNKQAEKVTGGRLYPHRDDLDHRMFWVCWDCSAWVGCHPKTDEPMGTLADYGLRQDRRAAHLAFDELWQSKEMTRSEAYTWLHYEFIKAAEGEFLKDPVGAPHIGEMNSKECKMVCDFIEQRLRTKHSKYVACIWEDDDVECDGNKTSSSGEN